MGCVQMWCFFPWFNYILNDGSGTFDKRYEVEWKQKVTIQSYRWFKEIKQTSWKYLHFGWENVNMG